MHALFDFNPAADTLELRIAFAYEPKILKNYITNRSYSGLLYIVRGAYHYSFETGSFTANTGSVLYLPPGSMPYAYQVLSGKTQPASTMQIEFELLSAHKKQPIAFSKHPICLFQDPTDAANSAFQQIITHSAKTDAPSRLAMQAELLSLLAMCASNASKKIYNPVIRQKIAPAIQYLQENYRKPLHIYTLAALCHVSESQLRRLFQAEIGKSPIAYKNELIKNDACNLLQSREYIISEVADILGFPDIYAFSHFFKRTVGISPTAYRQLKLESLYTT